MAYIADAASLRPGHIVKVESPRSSTGAPTYPHFFIVLAIPSALKPGGMIPLVGVSSGIDPKAVDPARHVAMKWLARQGGDPETGFFKPCHACVDFTTVLDIYTGKLFPLEVGAEFQGRFIRAAKLQAVIAAFNAWARSQH